MTGRLRTHESAFIGKEEFPSCGEVILTYVAIACCRRGLIKVLILLVLNRTWHGTIPCFGPENHDGLGGEMITPFSLAHEGSVKCDCRHY